VGRGARTGVDGHPPPARTLPSLVCCGFSPPAPSCIPKAQRRLERLAIGRQWGAACGLEALKVIHTAESGSVYHHLYPPHPCAPPNTLTIPAMVGNGAQR
jgi:hypothetical protein